jgi:hypothetical protein
VTPTVLAVVIAGPELPEPHLSLHTTGEQADRALLAAADDVYVNRFGYRLSPVLGGKVDYVIERLVREGYYVAVGERQVEL